MPWSMAVFSPADPASNRSTWAAMAMTPALVTASAMRRIAAMSGATGFSTRTARPASAAAVTWASCSAFGRRDDDRVETACEEGVRIGEDLRAEGGGLRAGRVEIADGGERVAAFRDDPRVPCADRAGSDDAYTHAQPSLERADGTGAEDRRRSSGMDAR
jgi:hypothetical protein